MKALKYRSKKAKGKRLELKIASMIRAKGLDDNARAMPMSGAIEGFKSDIYTRIPLTIEAKNNEHHELWKEWNQAKEQEKPLNPACLVISGNSRPILAMVELDTLLELLKEIQDLRKT